MPTIRFSRSATVGKVDVVLVYSISPATICNVDGFPGANGRAVINVCCCRSSAEASWIEGVNQYLNFRREALIGQINERKGARSVNRFINLNSSAIAENEICSCDFGEKRIAKCLVDISCDIS